MVRVPAFLGFAVEGWVRAALPLLLAAALLALGQRKAALAALVVAAAVLLFFRDPERSSGAAAGGVLSPADGRVVVVERVREERHLHADARQISVFMNIFNVHVNRAPFDATVVSVTHLPGRFRFADAEGAGIDNERVEVVLEDAAGRRALMVQVAGFVARRIVCRLSPGDRLSRGERFGLICFGSRVDIFLPDSYSASVRPGDRVRAGETLVGAAP